MRQAVGLTSWQLDAAGKTCSPALENKINVVLPNFLPPLDVLAGVVGFGQLALLHPQRAGLSR